MTSLQVKYEDILSKIAIDEYIGELNLFWDEEEVQELLYVGPDIEPVHWTMKTVIFETFRLI